MKKIIIIFIIITLINHVYTQARWRQYIGNNCTEREQLTLCGKDLVCANNTCR